MNFTNSSLIEFIPPTFSIIDYTVFAGFLCISGAVGIFFSVKGHRNTNDYFFGGKEMGAVPIGISNGVSFLSALALIGLPSEYYINGSDILLDPILGCICFLISGFVIAYVIHPLKMSSLTEYFRKRYNSKPLSYVTNIMVLICIFEYMAGTMLASALALSSVTGGQVTFVMGLMIAGAVGIFYTSIGGLKAVVWTDVIQFGFMLIGISAVLIHAISDTPGGLATIVDMNVKLKRIHPFNFSLDPRVRHSFWGMVIGKSVYLLMWPIQPAGVQRQCSTKTRRDSCMVAIISAVMNVLLTLLPLMAGFSIFGYYASRGCDIFAAGWVKKNEIVLYYTRERLSYPGFQGFFVAALFAGSLSSFSSGLSAASALLWKEAIQPLLPFTVNEIKATILSKGLVVIFGVFSLMWSYAMHSFGGLILQVTFSFDASMYGAYFSLFVLALFFRNGGSKGAIAGLIVSFSVALWLGLGSMLKGQQMITKWPVVTDTCSAAAVLNTSTIPANFNHAANSSESSCPKRQSLLDIIYSISYIWLPSICVLVSLLVAALVNGCTGGDSFPIEEKYLFPLCRKNTFSSSNIEISDGTNTDVEEEIKLQTIVNE